MSQAEFFDLPLRRPKGLSLGPKIPPDFDSKKKDEHDSLLRDVADLYSSEMMDHGAVDSSVMLHLYLS